MECWHAACGVLAVPQTLFFYLKLSSSQYGAVPIAELKNIQPPAKICEI